MSGTEKISDLTGQILAELVDPQRQLSDILLKVKMLAYWLKNEKLKSWVEDEINGFIGRTAPDYRMVHAEVFGDLIQDVPFNVVERRRFPLPLEGFEAQMQKRLREFYVGASVAEIEQTITSNGQPQNILPYFVSKRISNVLKNGWIVQLAWQEIQITSLSGILSKIRSQLMSFLLEIQDRNLVISESFDEIDKIFDAVFGETPTDENSLDVKTDDEL